jgi:hypothetical protein
VRKIQAQDRAHSFAKSPLCVPDFALLRFVVAAGALVDGAGAVYEVYGRGVATLAEDGVDIACVVP